jgi:hypothetical protein
MAALRVFQRTPRGSALKATCDAANEALESLRGHSFEGISFAVRGPGAFSLTLETNQTTVTLHIDRHGVRVRNMEVGL